MLEAIILLCIACALIAIGGLFVAAEFAFITVNRTKVDALASKGDTQAVGLATALKSLSTQLFGIQLGVTIIDLAVGFLAEPISGHLFEGPLQSLGLPSRPAATVSAGIGVILVTLLVMMFGELIPKNIALARPLGTAKFVQGTVRRFSSVMRGPIRLLNNTSNAVLRRINIEPQQELISARSADELSSLVRRSAETGSLPKETAEMLERSLVFGELTAQDVMTPRVRIHSLGANDTAAEVLDLARETGLSRFPVIAEDLDHVIGLVHIKHAVAIPKESRKSTTLNAIMQPPVLVPFSINLEPLLTTLRSGGLQMAVVIDEFGGTAGIITVEDLLEELVGEVHDEHDPSSHHIRSRKQGGWLVSGLLRPDEIADELDIFLPESEEYETVAGLFTDRLGRLGAVGDHLSVTAVNRDGQDVLIKLTVSKLDERRIDRLRLEIVDLPNNDNGSSEAAS